MYKDKKEEKEKMKLTRVRDMLICLEEITYAYQSSENYYVVGLKNNKVIIINKEDGLAIVNMYKGECQQKSLIRNLHLSLNSYLNSIRANPVKI